MVQGENGLHYKAEFDIEEFKRNGEEMLRMFKKIQAEGEKSFNFKTNTGNTGVDTKPLTAFQAANLDLRKVLLEASVATEKLRQENLALAASLKAGRITQQQATATERENRIERQNLTRATKEARTQQSAANGSYNEAQQRLKQLGAQIKGVNGGFASQSPLMQARIREYSRLNSQLTEFDRRMGNHQRNIGNYKSGLNGIGNSLASLTAGYLTATAAITLVGKVISSNAEISDSLADVRRTASLTQVEADSLLETFKGFDTRTGLKGLLDIATIAGQLGIAKEDIAGFTRSIDQLAVVLSSEIPGGAEAVATALGKINGVFETQAREGTDIEEAYNRTGSAILGLGQAGLATGEFLQDFTLRVAGVSKAANITLPTVLAYGAVLEEAGSSAEVAGTSINRLIGNLSSKRDKFFAIAQLQDSTLTIDKFTNLINTDANQALQLFFKGLNSGNPTLTTFNDRLDTIGIKAGPSKNAIIALAQGQASLSEKIKATNKDYLDADKIAEQIAIKNDNLAGSIDKLNKVFENATTSGNTGRFFKSIVDYLQISLSEFTKLVNSNSWKEFWARLSGGNAGNAIYDITQSFNSTSKRTNDNQKFLYPQGGNQAGTEAKLQALGASKFNAYLDNLKRTSKEAEQALKKYQDGVKSGELKESGSTIQEYRVNAQKAKTYYTDVLEMQKKFGFDKKKESVKQNEEQEESGARTQEAIKAEIKALQSLQRPLDVNSSKYKEYAANIKKLKAQLNGGSATDSRQETAALNRAKSLGEELAKNRAKSLRDQKESDNAELQSVIDSYDERRRKINEFFNNKDNKGQPIIIDNKNFSKAQALGYVNADQKRDEVTITAKQEVAKTKETIEAKKALFDEYEQYKLQAGTTEANRRFAAELKGFKSYVDYLKSLLPDAADRSVYANKMRDLINKDFIPAADKEAAKRQEDQFTELLKATASYQQQATALTETYEAQRAELLRRGKTENVKELDRAYKEQMDALVNNENAKADFTKRLAQQALILTRSEVKKQLEALIKAFSGKEIPDAVQRLIENLKSRLRIGPDQVNIKLLDDREKDLITALGAEVDETTPKFAELLEQLNEVRRLKKSLDSNTNGIANSGLGKFLSDLGDGDKIKGLGTGLGLASDAAMTLSQGLGGVDTAAGYTLDTIGQLAGAAGDLALSIASGDPAKIIGSAIKAVGTLFSIGKKVKEMNAAARKEVADFYAQAIAGEREYQDMLRQRQIENVRNNKIVLQGIRDEIALRKTQSAEYDKEAAEIMKQLQGKQYITGETYKHGTWFRKAQVNKTYASLNGMNFEQLSQLLAQGKLEGDAKALVERLKELEQKGYDADQAMAELAKTTAEIFTGTTADSLTDSLAEMFASGKTSAQDLADFFKQSMDDAALSIFKNKVLAGAMEKFYKQFDEAAESDDKLTDTEIADLQKAFAAMTDDAQKQFEYYKKITGSDLTGNNNNGSSNQNALTSSIKNIKQESFKELTSLLCRD